MRSMHSRQGMLLVALALLLAAAAAAVRFEAVGEKAGGDLQVICAADDVLAAGGNPYDRSQIEQAGGPVAMPLTYPPLLVRTVAHSCGRGLAVSSALALLTLLIVAWRGRVASLPIAAAAIGSGFAALPWLLITANIAALEGVAGALAVTTLLSGVPVLFGAAMGVIGFVKVTPLLLVLAAFIRWPKVAAIKALASSIVMFIALHAAGYLLDAESTRRYLGAVLEGFGGYVAAEIAFGSEANPSMFSFLPYVAGWVGVPREAGLAAAALVASAFGLAWLRLWRRSGGSGGERMWLALLMMAVITICHPRFKPYSPFLLTSALAFVLQRLAGRPQHAGLVLACVLPNLLLLILTIVEDRRLGLAVPLFFSLQYAQWICAAAALAMALRPAVFRQLAGAGAR